MNSYKYYFDVNIFFEMVHILSVLMVHILDAKHGASSSDTLKSLICCPLQLHRSLLNDALGVAHLRL